MKIVMLCDLYAEQLRFQENLLAKYYARHGHDVTVIAATFSDIFAYYADRYDRRAPSRVYWDGPVKVMKLPYSLNLFNKLRRFGGVRRILNAEAPQLIFAHSIHLNLFEAAAYARRHPGCRLVMDYHGDASNSGKNWLSRVLLHGIIRRAVLWSNMRDIDRIFPVVPAAQSFLSDIYGVPMERMELLPLGVDTEYSHAVRSQAPGRRIRASLGIPDDSFVVFTGGKITPRKRTHLLAEAVVGLGDPRIHLVIVGDGGPDAAEYLTGLRARFEGEPRIHFVGWVAGAEVYDYMDACDVAVFPASQSVLWQQALGMGLPLIVGRVGVQDSSYMNVHENMIILDEDEITAQAIARELSELRGDVARLQRLRDASLRVAEERLSYDRIVEQTLA